MGWRASVYARGLKLSPTGEEIKWDLKAFLLLAASYYDERQNIVRASVDQLAADAKQSTRWVYACYQGAVTMGIMERHQVNRRVPATYSFRDLSVNHSAVEIPESVNHSAVESEPQFTQTSLSVNHSAVKTEDTLLSIPRVPTDKSTNGVDLLPEQQTTPTKKVIPKKEKTLPPGLQETVIFWESSGHPKPISATATTSLKEFVDAYGVDQTKWVIEKAATEGKIGAHAWMRVVLASEIVRQQGGARNGRSPYVSGPARNGASADRIAADRARRPANISGADWERIIQADAERRRAQDEYDERKRLRELAGGVPGRPEEGEVRQMGLLGPDNDP